MNETLQLSSAGVLNFIVIYSLYIYLKGGKDDA